MREEKIPEVSKLTHGYTNKLELEVCPDIILSFPREERAKLLHNEVERMLLMLDWEEQRREVADYVQSKKDEEGD